MREAGSTVSCHRVRAAGLSKFSHLSGDAHPSCRRLCLTQRVLRDCGILTLINMVWVGNCEICKGVYAWRLPSASSVDWYSSLEEDPVAHLVVLPNYQEDEAAFRRARENLRRARSGEKHKRIVLTMEGLEGPNSQDKAERFMAVCTLFEDTRGR